MKPFKDLVVVELANVLAGPSVGMFFAELGATVHKIENIQTQGDITRSWKLPTEDPKAPLSAYYHSINYGKQAMLLDLNQPEAKAQVITLLETADIVIANFKDSAAKRMGLDYDTLSKLNPRLIYAQLYAYANPDDTRPAFDVVLQAEAGFLYMTGEHNDALVKMPVALIDLLAGHQLKEAVLIALLERSKTGKGGFVSTSLFESAVASLANQASNYLMAGHIPQPMGTRHPNIAPYGDLYLCSDQKPIVLAVGTEGQFQAFCQLTNLTWMLSDQRFATNAQRVVNRSLLSEYIKNALSSKSAAEWAFVFGQNGVPSGLIRNMQEVFELEESKSMILEQAEEDGSISRRVKTVAFRMHQAN